MTLTLGEKRELWHRELEERRKKEHSEIQQKLKEKLSLEDVELLKIEERDDSYRIVVAFTLDGYRQESCFYWDDNESQEDLILSVKRHVSYIKKLREEYPDYCKQNDYIQTNRKFTKDINLTHMGYKRKFQIEILLADYMELPNTTSTGFGGGDYQIKRTPKRVDEYNRNIDVTIDVLIDCISELRQRKYPIGCAVNEKQL